MARLTHLLPILLAVALSACGKSEDTAAPGENEKDLPVIGIVTSLESDGGWSNKFEEQARAEASNLGYHLVYLNSDGEPSEQGRQLRKLASEKVAAIAFQSYQPEQISSDLETVTDAEIALFAIGKPTAEISGLSASIGTSQTTLGSMAAEALAEALGDDGGQVLIIDCRDAPHLNQRVEGFKRAMESYRFIDIVSELPGNGNHDGGLAATADALESHPGLAGIFAVNDSCAVGAIDATGAHPHDQPIKIIAIDDSLAGAKNGELTATIYQDPATLAAALIKTIDASLKGSEIDAHTEVAARKNP